ncbi:MAG: hypothetical protein ACU0B1_09560, partial [Thermohalobaculum sp.]
ITVRALTIATIRRQSVSIRLWLNRIRLTTNTTSRHRLSLQAAEGELVPEPHTNIGRAAPTTREAYYAKCRKR